MQKNIFSTKNLIFVVAIQNWTLGANIGGSLRRRKEKYGTIKKINENIWKIDENKWKSNENIKKIDENIQKTMKIYRKSMKSNRYFWWRPEQNPPHGPRHWTIKMYNTHRKTRFPIFS